MRREKLEELQDYIKELKAKKIKLIEKPEKKTFLKIETYQCELENGSRLEREKLKKGKREGSAAIILPITKEKNTILVVQPRVFMKNGVGIELPAGYMEKEESPLMAAKRELEEETGYIPKEMIELARYYQDQGCSAAYNYSYLAFGCEKEKQQQLDSDEIIHYFECRLEEAYELIEMGYIQDVQSQYTLEKAKTYIKKMNQGK